MILDRYPALFLAFAAALAATAQPTLVAPGNVPAPGNGFTVHRGAYVATPAGGAGEVFNYSTLSSASTLTYQWRSPGDLPNGGVFPGAQFALVNGGADTIFYKATANGLERVGDTQTIDAMGTNYPLISTYSNSMLDLKLPLSFGDTWTDLFQGSFVVQDGSSETSNRNGAVTGEADAWGWVVLPGGVDTVEVLRVRTRVTEVIPLTTGLGQLNVQHMHNQVAYYPLWGKFPVLRSVSDTLSVATPFPITITASYTEWLDGAFVGVAEHAADAFKAQVFPNPATDQAKLVFANNAMTPVQVRVVNAQGAVVKETRTAGRTLDMDVKDLENGIYGVVLSNDQGQRSTVRMVVVH